MEPRGSSQKQKRPFNLRAVQALMESKKQFSDVNLFVRIETVFANEEGGYWYSACAYVYPSGQVCRRKVGAESSQSPSKNCSGHICGSTGVFLAWRFYITLRDTSNDDDDIFSIPRFTVFQAGEDLMGMTPAQFQLMDRGSQLEKLRCSPSGGWKVTVESGKQSWMPSAIVSAAVRYPPADVDFNVKSPLPSVIEVEAKQREDCMRLLRRKLGFSSISEQALSEQMGNELACIVSSLRLAISNCENLLPVVEGLERSHADLSRHVSQLGDEIERVFTALDSHREDCMKIVSILDNSGM